MVEKQGIPDGVDWEQDLGSEDDRQDLLLSRFLNAHDLQTLYSSFTSSVPDEALWRTHRDSRSFTVDEQTKRQVPYNRRFQFVRMVGKPGSYGAAFLVLDISSSDKAEHRPYIIKISIFDKAFMTEVDAMRYTLQNAINSNISPTYVTPDSWFVSEFLPPSKGPWVGLERGLRQIEDFGELIDEARLQESRSGSSTSSSVDTGEPLKVRGSDSSGGGGGDGSERTLFGYIVMEYANSGTLSTFYARHLRPRLDEGKDIAPIVTSIVFQIVFALFSMIVIQLQHRDLASSNVVLTESAIRERQFGRKFQRPYLFTIGDTNFRLGDDTFSLMLIDYSLAKQVRNTVPEDARITRPQVRLFYRPPELLFIARGKRFVLFRNRSDMFSAGLSILRSVTRSNYLTREEAPEGLAEDIQRSCLTGELSTDTQRIVARFICKSDDAEQVAQYVWNLIMLIGPPTPRSWPGVENTDLYKLIKPYVDTELGSTFRPTVYDRSDQIFQRLGEHGVTLVRRMLRWDPAQRPQSLDLLQTHPFFDSIRSARDRENEEPHGSRWGLDKL